MKLFFLIVLSVIGLFGLFIVIGFIESAVSDWRNRAIRRARDELAGIGQLHDLIVRCGAIGSTLRELDQPIVGATRETEWERYRARVSLRILQMALAIARVNTQGLPTPELIRARVQLERVKQCCSECANFNLKNVESHLPFQCLAQRATNQSFRFQLNDKGEIIEHQR